jgi:DNA-binding LacI/PurR family transcriptional regulator
MLVYCRNYGILTQVGNDRILHDLSPTRNDAIAVDHACGSPRRTHKTMDQGRTILGWREIAASFQNDIEEGRLPEGAVIPSETELAARWNVSRMTIHRAMTLLQEQGLVTRKRRAGTVVTPRNRRTLQHTPASQNVKAKRHERGSGTDTPALAFVIDDQKDRLAMEYIRGVSTAVPPTHRLLFFNTQGSPQREAQCLRELHGQADGIILFPIGVHENVEVIQQTLRKGIPIVALDRDVEYEGVSSVTSDNYGASLMGLRYLVQRGHARIAHFTWGLRDDPEVAPVQERYNAWHAVMRESGSGDPSRWLRRYPQHVSADLEHLTQFAKDALFAMLHQPEAPSAVFCVNDYFLIALLQACEDMGVRVPDDLEILSFNDGVQLMPRQERSVHRLVQRTEAMGRRATELLLTRIADHRLPEDHVRMTTDFYPAVSHAGADTDTPTDARNVSLIDR